MIKVVSTFANTDVVPANSHGPYVVNAGSPVNLSAGVPNPNATYQWELGDGATAATPSVVHTYGDDGLYIAKLMVTVNQPGGATSRHFALIEARNVPPTVSAGPNRTVNEGDPVAFTGTFSDPAWLESHQAMWDWGDSQRPDLGVVAETHNPPAAQGTVTGSHAWGDSGTYPVTLTVQGEGGAVGRSQTTVTVLNVPPTVDAGRPMFAYPCCVLTMEGHFTDPGWLDSHAGFWDFGDSTGLQRAVVRETNQPPAAKGVAISSHVYHECGTYQAICTVIDDDGGVGKSSTIIQVVDIRNAGFEQGFHLRQSGAVANHWEPYLAKVPVIAGSEEFTPLSIAPTSGTDIFLAEEYLVHHGERAQRIRFQGKSRAGILQLVGANPGWDYQVTVSYSLSEQAGGVSQLIKDEDDPTGMLPTGSVGGVARLGIDPKGATDPSAPSILWSEGYTRRHWAQLSVRVTAQADGVTIYLEGEGAGGLAVDVCFDDAALVAVQPFCPPTEPPKDQWLCVNFSDLKTGTRMPPIFVKDGFRFIALDNLPQLIVGLGVPAGQNKLQFHPRGLEVDLPFVADAVRVTISDELSVPVQLTAYDASRHVVGQTTTARGAGAFQTLEIQGPGINSIAVTGKEEQAVVEICAHPQIPNSAPVRTGGQSRTTG
jgi:hypothetical protein